MKMNERQQWMNCSEPDREYTVVDLAAVTVEDLRQVVSGGSLRVTLRRWHQVVVVGRGRGRGVVLIVGSAGRASDDVQDGWGGAGRRRVVGLHDVAVAAVVWRWLGAAAFRVVQQLVVLHLPRALWTEQK